ncbi:cytochrome c oxidase assembly protein [Sphingomonas sp.]|uniref:cytochrome c oxidase assembly protein n=1 Tax=Sphingomonas sp. TaxID=28214 RepID=UPI0035C81CA3
MRRAGWALAILSTLLAFAGLGMTGHMVAHMIAVAVAAPLFAFSDAGRARVGAGAPLAWAMAEFLVVWSWHAPALRAIADHYAVVTLIEQASFLAIGVALWRSAVAQPAAGVAALLLTSMHMTLLGALIGLADRPLFAMMAMHAAPGLDALADQQLGGVAMLVIGGASYCLGGLWLLGTMLKERTPA